LVLLFSLPGLLVYMILRPKETLADQYERALEEEALLQDIEDRLVCPGCQRKVEPDFMVCPSCQTMLKTRCRACDRLLHPKWQVCPYCTTPVTPALPERISETPAAARGEDRRRPSRPERQREAPAPAAAAAVAPEPEVEEDVPRWARPAWALPGDGPEEMDEGESMESEAFEEDAPDSRLPGWWEGGTPADEADEERPAGA